MWRRRGAILHRAPPPPEFNVPNTAELLNLAYNFIDVDSTRVPAAQMRGWAVRAVNDLVLQLDSIPAMWYILAPLERSETFQIGSNEDAPNQVSISSDFLKIRPQGYIVGRRVTFFLSQSEANLQQGRVGQATLAEPQVVIVSESGENVICDVIPHQFQNFKLTMKTIAVPDFTDTALTFSPTLTELIISRIAIIAAEEMADSSLLELATSKWNTALSSIHKQ